MTIILPTTTPTIDATERAWLFNYCHKLCGDHTVADDLAQETLLVAWQQHGRRPVEVAPRAWLAGIAQNMFRRWARERQRETQRWLPLDDDATLVARDEIEIDLERHELAELLDRAMELLPPATRTALIAHYIEEQPQALIAHYMGVSEGAVAVRLHRGKLALRRILARDGEDALPFSSDVVAWEATALWCPFCGRHHLEGKFDAAHRGLRLRCSACGELMDHRAAVLGTKTYGAALNRINRWLAAYYLPAAATGFVSCCGCGQKASMGVLPEVSTGIPVLTSTCRCGVQDNCIVTYLALLTEEGQRFIRDHRRIRLDNMTTAEGPDGPLGILTYASVEGAARYVARYRQDTLHMLP
ncbi:MAG: RNA polymerase sigma factor [Ktedonobacterales bacterium]|nr:RNA polymerase sigma factor [Ktedonobacterales bacterium]